MRLLLMPKDPATFTAKLDVAEVHRKNRLGQLGTFRRVEEKLEQVLRGHGFTVIERCGWDLDEEEGQYTYTLKATPP
jgi:hypothetical protein